MDKTMKAYKYDINFAADWWLKCYFDYKIEDIIASPMYSQVGFLKTLDDAYISISHIVYFEYLGEYEISVEGRGKVQEIAKISETK